VPVVGARDAVGERDVPTIPDPASITVSSPVAGT
jgi:hypothetical protein